MTPDAGGAADRQVDGASDIKNLVGPRSYVGTNRSGARCPSGRPIAVDGTCCGRQHATEELSSEPAAPAAGDPWPEDGRTVPRISLSRSGSLEDVPITADADALWASSARRALAHLIRGGGEFTADDLRDLGVTEPDHPARWGALFQAEARAGRLETVGARRSTREGRRGSLVRIWRATRNPERSEGGAA